MWNVIYDQQNLQPPWISNTILIKGKHILQDLYRNNYNEDDKVPHVYIADWEYSKRKSSI